MQIVPSPKDHTERHNYSLLDTCGDTTPVTCMYAARQNLHGVVYQSCISTDDLRVAKQKS